MLLSERPAPPSLRDVATRAGWLLPFTEHLIYHQGSSEATSAVYRAENLIWVDDAFLGGLNAGSRVQLRIAGLLWVWPFGVDHIVIPDGVTSLNVSDALNPAIRGFFLLSGQTLQIDVTAAEGRPLPGSQTLDIQGVQVDRSKVRPREVTPQWMDAILRHC